MTRLTTRSTEWADTPAAEAAEALRELDRERPRRPHDRADFDDFDTRQEWWAASYEGVRRANACRVFVSEFSDGAWAQCSLHGWTFGPGALEDVMQVADAHGPVEPFAYGEGQ